MTLKDYQTSLTAGTLYRVAKKNGGSEQMVPSLEIIGGAVAIYGSQTLPASPPTGMYQTVSGFTGIAPFAMVPSFLYIVGSPTSILASGLDVIANPAG